MRHIRGYAGRHTKRKKRNFRPLFVLAALVCIVIALASFVVELYGPDIKPDAEIRYIEDIPVYEDLILEDAAGRILQKREIKYIVIHETANTSAGADAEAHNIFIHSNSMENEHSWHYTVDDKQIYHHVPDDEPAYHAGDHLELNGGNLNGIGIEICVASDNDYEKTLDNAARLSARLLREYDLNPRTALKTHHDFSGKKCPQILLSEGRWTSFSELTERYYKEFVE